MRRMLSLLVELCALCLAVGALWPRLAPSICRELTRMGREKTAHRLTARWQEGQAMAGRITARLRRIDGSVLLRLASVVSRLLMTAAGSAGRMLAGRWVESCRRKVS